MSANNTVFGVVSKSDLKLKEVINQGYNDTKNAVQEIKEI